MIIKNVKLTRTETTTTLSADCKIRKIGWDKLYFSVDNENAKYVADDASPFAAALLLPSMKQGEDLIIKGSLSQQLYVGMQAIMKETLSWNLGLSPIAIKVDALHVDKFKSQRTASFFSGGVDSFYTYLSHKKDAVETDRVKSLVLVNGFEIDLRSKDLWKLTHDRITAIAAAEQVELVVVESNLYKMLDPILVWDYSHGGSLAAVGLFLRAGFNRFYIPSTFASAEQVPWGSHPAIDPLWGGETLQFIHDGDVTRLDKVKTEVSKSPVALKYLRVCYMNTVGTYNCGVCAKCLRTMINLYLSDALDKASTFPKQLDLKRIANTPVAINEGKQLFTAEDQHLGDLRARHLNPELQEAILSSMKKTIAIRAGAGGGKRKAKLSQFIRHSIYFDHVYNRGYGYIVLAGLFGRKFS